MVAEELFNSLSDASQKVKGRLTYLLPARFSEVPEKGRVIKLDECRWSWLEERTVLIQRADAIIALGGGRGTVDCIEKALLAGKPVFVAGAIPGHAADVWRNPPADHHYLVPGDSEFTEDVNSSPEEFFQEVFRIIDALGATKYSRRIFIVHGKDHHLRDTLVAILRQLRFEPIVLQQLPGQGRTIIENIEAEAANVGFAFIVYTANDMGRGTSEPEKPRARQNVVFEHGMLIGILGRERTCALIKGEVELPADVHGLIYEPVRDLNQEAINIARILKQANYEADLSALL